MSDEKPDTEQDEPTPAELSGMGLAHDLCGK